MRILITGCGGMLGEAVYAEMEKEYEVYATDIDQNEDWLHYLDVRNLAAVRKFGDIVYPKAVIHLAALTDMEHCELNPTQAYDVNFMGVHNALAAARKFSGQFVYISSAGVFDGSKEEYREDDIPQPLNVYAKSKYAGELAALEYPRSIVIRAGWMMGGGPLKDKKFVNKVIKQVRGGAEVIHVVNDKLGTPTYTYELAKTIRQLLEQHESGIFHGACEGGGSRADVAREMLGILGLQDKVSIEMVNSSYFSKEYFARRPFSEKLISKRLLPTADWQDCLKDYLGRFEWGL